MKRFSGAPAPFAFNGGGGILFYMSAVNFSGESFSLRRFNLKHVIYALALMSLLLWVRVLFGPYLGQRAIFPTFYPAIIGVAWILGLWPALLSIVFITVGSMYYFYAPYDTLFVMASPDQIQIALNIFVLIFCSVVADLGRKSRERVLTQMQELRAGDALLQAVTNNARVGLVVIDANHTYVSVNEAYAEMLGVRATDIIGKCMQDVLGPVYQDAKDRVDNAFAGKLVSFEQILPPRGPQKTERVLDIKYEVRNDLPSGKSVVAMVLDITQRRATERALTESQERLRTLAAVVEHSVDFIGVCSTQMQPIFVNDAGLKMMGLDSIEDAQRRPVIDFFHPEDRERVQREAIPALDREGQWNGAVRFQNFKTGETIHTYWNVFAIRDMDGKVAGWATISPNLNELRKAEDTLRGKRARTQLLNDALAHLLTTNDPERMVTELFPRVASALNLDVYFNYLINTGGGNMRLHSAGGIDAETKQKFATLDIGQALCGTSAQTLRPVVATKLQESADPKAAGVKSLGLQAYVCHPLMVGERLIGTLSFGSRTRVEFSIDEINFLRTITQYVAIALDRAERDREFRRSGEALRESESRLKEAGRRKDEFIALLAHELRNPLAPIRNGLAILKGSPTRDQSERALVMIDRQAVHMTKLIDDLLDVARVKSGKLKLTMRRVELGDIVRKTIEDHRVTLEKNGLRISLDITMEPLWVNGDPTRLSQIVENLVTNAGKFTDAGGHVAITLHEERKRAVLKVKDSGIGLDPATIARLFEPFTQADTSLDRSRGGLGLGLALVKGLVDAHGATIMAESEGLQKGSVFSVQFPLELDMDLSAPTPAPTYSNASAPRRVLIIEDNLDAAETLKIFLGLAGHEVHLSHNGRDGIDAAKRLHPEVVICDIGLPGELDGYGVAKAMRADPFFKNTRLIALSGYGQEEDRRRARSAGFDLHVTKPVDPDHLNNLLQTTSYAKL